MTIQELIDELSKIEDKERRVIFDTNEYNYYPENFEYSLVDYPNKPGDIYIKI